MGVPSPFDVLCPLKDHRLGKSEDMIVNVGCEGKELEKFQELTGSIVCIWGLDMIWDHI